MIKKKNVNPSCSKLLPFCIKFIRENRRVCWFNYLTNGMSWLVGIVTLKSRWHLTFATESWTLGQHKQTPLLSGPGLNTVFQQADLTKKLSCLAVSLIFFSFWQENLDLLNSFSNLLKCGRNRKIIHEHFWTTSESSEKSFNRMKIFFKKTNSSHLFIPLQYL